MSLCQFLLALYHAGHAKKGSSCMVHTVRAANFLSEPGEIETSSFRTLSLYGAYSLLPLAIPSDYINSIVQEEVWRRRCGGGGGGGGGTSSLSTSRLLTL